MKRQRDLSKLVNEAVVKSSLSVKLLENDEDWTKCDKGQPFIYVHLLEDARTEITQNKEGTGVAPKALSKAEQSHCPRSFDFCTPSFV